MVQARPRRELLVVWMKHLAQPSAVPNNMFFEENGSGCVGGASHFLQSHSRAAAQLPESTHHTSVVPAFVV